MMRLGQTATDERPSRRPAVVAAGLALVLLGGVHALAASSPVAQSYDAWRAAHPKADAEVAALKAGTAALVPGGPLAGIDRPPAIWRVKGGIDSVWDGPGLPRMTVIPAGEYTMGSPATEPGRAANEGPRHRVRIGYPFAVSTDPVTVGQFARFVAESGHTMLDQCQTFTAVGKWDFVDHCTWREPGFPQGEDGPVTAINWRDALAYVAWLSKTTGHTYRLLSEAEYEYAARAGTTTAYWWGTDPAKACAVTNGADLDAKAMFPRWTVNAGHDGAVYPAPAAGLKPNAFGLRAMAGNTWSWVQDCWSDSYVGAPTDGSARGSDTCTQPMIRGGSWADVATVLRSAGRGWNIYNIRFTVNGLRVARTL